jgi:hypothetical protein
MAATGTLGAQLSVGASPLVTVTGLTITSFQGLGYTAVGFVENLGEFGRQFETVKFVSVNDARTLKLKGPYDDGTMQMTVGSDLFDAGQQILFNAGTALDQNTYPFQLILVGASAYWDTIYFGGKVMSFRFQAGAANSVFRGLVNLEVNTEVFVGDS